MSMKPVALRHYLHQFNLDLERRLADGKAGAIADAENVGIDGDGRFAESDVKHHIGGLAADTRQGFERIAVVRNLTAVFGDELFR